MSKFLKILLTMVVSLLMISCAQRANLVTNKDSLATYTQYSDIEPKGKQPKARITVIQVGSRDFRTLGLQVYNQEKRDESGYLTYYLFGSKFYADKVADIPGIVVPDDLVQPINQLNIRPGKAFIFTTSVGKYKRVEPGWFKRGYTERVTCKWNNKKLVFIPKEGKDYLLSIGAIPTQEEKKFLCILKLQAWDKITKQYQKVPFILYPGK